MVDGPGKVIDRQCRNPFQLELKSTGLGKGTLCQAYNFADLLGTVLRNLKDSVSTQTSPRHLKYENLLKFFTTIDRKVLAPNFIMRAY